MFDYDRNEHFDMYKQTMQFEVLEEEMRSTIGNVDDPDSFEEDEFGYVNVSEADRRKIKNIDQPKGINRKWLVPIFLRVSSKAGLHLPV